MKRRYRSALPLLWCPLLLATPAYGDDTPDGWKTEGVVTVVGQSAQEAEIDDELLASFDVVTSVGAAGGEWLLHIEGSTTPDEDAVASLLPESNADAGTALDDDGKGRIQVSELFYTTELGTGQVSAGLLDATAFLDQSRVANDETSQFLGITLVNNPTIEFPDYALGFAYQAIPETGFGYSLVIMSSHGLAENNASYSELLDIDDEGKGAFVAAEIFWERDPGVFRLGLWGHLSDHDRLDGEAGVENNYGLYTVFDTPAAGGLLNLRAGVANPEVSKASAFAALAYELPFEKSALGAGLSHTWVSSEGQAADEDDLTQAELYFRYAAAENLTVSPSLQWIRNSEFRNVEPFDNQSVLSARLNYTF